MMCLPHLTSRSRNPHRAGHTKILYIALLMGAVLCRLVFGRQFGN